MAETVTNSATLTFGYKGTTFTRKYKFEGLEDDALADIKGKVIDFNDSISGGTDTELGNFFVSDDFNASENIGNLTGITAASYNVETVTDIPLKEV